MSDPNTICKWSSSDSSVATVSASGKVKGLQKGSTTITCKYENTGRFSSEKFPSPAPASVADTKIITVKTDMKVISDYANPEKEPKKVIFVGDSVDYDVLMNGIAQGGLESKGFTWTSNKLDVATVDNNGKLKATGKGNTTITAKYKDGTTATLSLTVKQRVEGISLPSKENVMVGKSIKLSPINNPSNADDKYSEFTWKSSKSKVATVDKNGKVTGKRTGSTTITATTKNGKFKTSCRVKVDDKNTVILPSEEKGLSGIQISLRSTSWVTNTIRYEYVKEKPKKINEYRLYQKTSRYGDWKLIHIKKYDSSFKKSYKGYSVKSPKITSKKHVWYKVIGWKVKSKKKKQKFAESEILKIVVGKPVLRATSQKVGSIKIEWDKIGGATSYKIYKRVLDSKSKYKMITNIKTNKYIDSKCSQSEIYKYYVVPYKKKKAGNQSDTIDARSKATINSQFNLNYVKNEGKELWKYVCKDNEPIDDYTVEGNHPAVKYQFDGKTLYIHVYVKFVSYTKVNKNTAKKMEYPYFARKNLNSKKDDPEFTTGGYNNKDLFVDGVVNAYSNQIIGSKNDFKEGVVFNTKITLHTNNPKHEDKQKYVEIRIGNKCPHFDRNDKEVIKWAYDGDPWYHKWGYLVGNEIQHYIYMPNKNQVYGGGKNARDYKTAAGHEMGHILGLNDAYDNYGADRCLENNETTYEFTENEYDALMISHKSQFKILPNDVEMMLNAYTEAKGEGLSANESYNTFTEHRENGDYDYNKSDKIITDIDKKRQ